MRLLVFCFLVQLASAWAAVPACDVRYQTVCASLPKSPVLARYPDGTLLLNPRVLTGSFDRELASLLGPDRINRAHFDVHILPVFEAVKAQLVRMIEVAAGRPLGTTPYRHLVQATLAVEDRERCRRANRSPLVASYDQRGNRVVICPIMTHLPARSLLTVLAHELGHAVDPCRVGGSTNVGFIFQELSDCVSATCPRNETTDEEEDYADYVSSTLSQAVLAARPELFEFSADPTLRFVEYVNYRLVGCDVDGVSLVGVLALLRQRDDQGLLGCQGLETQQRLCPVP